MSFAWLLRRLLLMIYTVAIVCVLVFAITQALPADAAQTLLGENASPEALAAVRTRLGLDDPVWLQFVHWVARAVSGNFGVSMRTGLPVAPEMLTALSRSLLLAAGSLALTLLVAVPMGMFAALRQGRVADTATSVIAYLGVSLPEFVTATVLALLLTDIVPWLPATGYVSPLENIGLALRHLALPVLTVSVILVAHVMRMMRSETLDVLQSDYVRAARLKGLPERTVLVRHVMGNALLPVITIVALDVGYLLGGIIVIEEIFAIPGIGRALMIAITTRDLPSIQAGAMIMATTYAITNTLADVVYALLDRRIRYD
ncbi:MULTISPECIES: ABC transporter permease [Bradyrhizobium]|uniref:ABC transporter permease n=6 Tax=Pseudomonadota TaxID=1224 RepID=A0ABS5GE55_9BRAD|nr:MULTISPECIES: ABC transporter permease [Bradyrhizobium]MBR1139618.1 ABC transporter permease [Bradyrhizobium denitrificans]MDU1495379.1 ABC transporter permease [Bradyrhizobium sp.]MDU1545434.1 ABC transporter permease [Bradyrhizobium sp.]MDU1665028.1 ABC transporter permease [Bradyrhizobium sp.]MDU1690059.1 ABC transporter permease [Bradyrhizobium sp.]